MSGAGAVLTADTTMAEVMRDQRAAAVLMRFHIGGCSMCGFAPTDRLAQVAEDHGVPVRELLAALRPAEAR